MTPKHVRTAQDWHGGQSSPMYQYSCTGIENKDHAVWLADEIKMCLKIQQLEDPYGEYERKRLLSFLDYVQAEMRKIDELGGEA